MANTSNTYQGTSIGYLENMAKNAENENLSPTQVANTMFIPKSIFSKASNKIFKAANQPPRQSSSQFRNKSKTFLFQDLAKDAKFWGYTPRDQEGRDWFRKRALEVGSINPRNLFKKQQNWIINMSQYMIGRMLLFEYSAKLKNDLPYWDRYPLIFPFALKKDGFLGINMHYLSPFLRAKLMDGLYTLVNNNRFDDRTKINLNYGILKTTAQLKYYKPCVKRYLNSNVKSVFLYITPREWDFCLELPLARFQKTTKQTVWKDSQDIINRM